MLIYMSLIRTIRIVYKEDHNNIVLELENRALLKEEEILHKKLKQLEQFKISFRLNTY